MSEKIFNGIGASPGIVIGRAYLLDRRKVVVELTKRGDAKLKRVSLPHRDELQIAGRRLLRALEEFISQNGARTRRAK